MKKSILLRSILIFSLFLFSKNIQAQLFASVNNVVCVGDEVVVTVTGGSEPYIVDWGDGTTTMGNVNQNSFFYVYGFGGTFQISITDAQGDSTVVLVDVIFCPIDIIGNFEPCQGDCETYSTSTNQVVFWNINDQNGNTIFSWDSNPMEYCWSEPGIYTITAQDDLGNFSEQSVVVGASSPIDIVSLSNTFCVADSLNPSSCDKICSNSTAIYTVPNGQNVMWEVLGADSYVENGNQVTVEWGAPGSGLVTAVMDGANANNMLINCSSTIQEGPAGFIVFLQAFASGGSAPYTYTWTSPSGDVISDPSGVPVEAGAYAVVVTDANGNTTSCQTFVVGDQSTGTGCLFSFSINKTNESGCDFCDGQATVSASSPFSNGFTFLWGNGSTGQTVNNLCSGTYSVTVTDDFGCAGTLDFLIDCPVTTSTCPATTSVCIDILENPDAGFTTIPAAVNGVVSICEGGTVVFNNESEGATLFEWNFGNGNFSTATNTEETYLTAGTYEAFLISRNDCYCSDTSFVTIEVTDAISPTLDCVGTICENTTTTYSTDANCSGFGWTITGDYNIIDGGGTADNFITIEWLSGPQGIIELAVSGCSGGNYCLEPTVEVVPIISDNAEIKGPEKVCRMDESTYYIDDYSATDFNWSVTAGGTILEGQNTNSIKVRWDGPISPNVQQVVSVDYDNCYLGCGGSDTKDVFILSDLYMIGDIEACANGMSTHEAKKDVVGVNDVMCDWTVTAGDGTVVWTSPASADEVNLDWNTIATAGSGRYAIQAIPTNPLEVCTPFVTNYISIVTPPDAPTSVGGITQICPGEVYTYDVLTPNPNYIFKWTINDGGVISNQEGSSINVTFGTTTPYILSVTQTSTDGLACESQPVDLEVFPLPAFTVNGDGNVCEETEGTYIADFFPGVKYEWTIVPDDAGTILSGENTNTIEVFWHQDGNANVQVTMCGSTESTPVTIIAKPTPVVTGDLFVCPGDATTIGVASAYDSYLWKTEDGNTITNTPTVNLPAGAFELIVTNSFGCENNVAFEIEGYPEPAVTVSVPGSRLRCYTGPDPDPIAEIHATEVPAGYTYQWYINGVAQPGMNSSVITSAEFGTFQVAVLDQNGCETFSNTITIFDYCGSGGGVCNNPGLPAACDQGTDVQMTFSGTNECDIFNFQNTSPNFVAGTEQWDFDDISSGPNNFSSASDPSHQFSNVGYYIVTLTALTPAGVLCYDSKLVTVPVSPDFDFGTACVDEALAFEDLTGFLPDEVVTSWSWDFGDPTSGANNISSNQNPAHAYSAPGDYDVTLTVGHGTGCTATRVKTITIETPPTIDFDEPILNCEGTALSFASVASADVLFYDWNFGDAISGAANVSEIANPFHAYENAGNYNVTCTVTDVWGCTESVTKVVTVAPNTLVGQISFSTPSPICEGDVTTLTAPPGGVSWEWSDGTFGASITTGEAGAYTVTITNSIGCQYIPPTAVLDVIPLPTAAIQAVEYDEFGQPVNIFYDNYSTCEGEDIHLQVANETANYAYTWSDGTVGSDLEYSEDRGNLLTAGTYTLTLDIVDMTTGCSNTVGPFDIVVHPTPTNIQITSSPMSPVCENTLTTFTVDNPSIDLTYVWNTGELGTSIQGSAAGEYFVRGITMFGCSAESNKIEISQGPDLKKIPDGCHTRCKADTICLPTINGVVDYQWYLDGNVIAGPTGAIGNYIALESGDYHVVMTDVNGCVTTSDILSLDLYDGFGTFEGNVYMDVNGNGIIDGPDTLVSGINIILNNNGVAIDTVTSGTNGTYTFSNIPSVAYNLDLDLNGLPANVIAVWNDLDSTLFGCDDMEVVDWLLQINCLSTITDFADDICFGENYIFDGAIVPVGVPTDFEYLDVLGCDSIITVTILELPNSSSYIELSSCDGNDVSYNGNTYPIGLTETPMTSPEGCAYIDSVDVVLFATNTTILNFDICPGEMIEYENEQYSAGTQLDFSYQDQNGCDSIVTLIVDGFPEIQFDLQSEEPCWNGSEGIITIENPTGAAPFTYSLDGTNFQGTPFFENLFAMSYMVYVQDVNGCVQEQAITLQGDPQLQINLPAPLLPCDGSGLVLAPQILAGDASNLTYLWSDGSTDSELTVNEEGTYVVGVSNECETVVQEVRISYENDNIESYLYIPNAFSPNGDGSNDKFRVYPAPNVNIESYALYVFDRWGNHLYDTHDTSEGWDGTLNSKIFNPGVYVYHIRIKVNSCGRTLDLFKKGDVTIIK